MRFSNLHTHSVFSDGKNTPLENAQKAIELNFVSLGFSDHSERLLGFDGALDSQKNRDYKKAVAEVKEAVKEKLQVFFGVEKDFLTPVDNDGYDYVLGSVHFIETTSTRHPIDHALEIQMDFLHNELKGDKIEYAKRYYDLVVQHAQNSSFHIQGHFDLINKFGLFDEPDDVYQNIALEALDEVLRLVPFIEVNTGAISRGYRTEPYPEDFLLSRILEKGGKLMINSDSHKAEHLDCHFVQSCEKLRKFGFSSIWQLQNSGFVEVNL